jgi:hypothetical protein
MVTTATATTDSAHVSHARKIEGAACLAEIQEAQARQLVSAAMHAPPPARTHTTPDRVSELL